MNPNISETLSDGTAQHLLTSTSEIAVAMINSKSGPTRGDMRSFLNEIGDSLIETLEKGRAFQMGRVAPPAVAKAEAPVKASKAVKAAKAVKAEPEESKSEAAVVEEAPVTAPTAEAPAVTAEAEQAVVSEEAPEAVAETEAEVVAEAAVEGEGDEPAAEDGQTEEEAAPQEEVYKFAHLSRIPVMDPEEAILGDELICLLDGLPRKMMSRHLKAQYGMTPAEYRFHFSLRSDYPVTSPGYSKEKSIFAKQQGLGTAKLYANASKKKRAAAKAAKAAKLKLAAAAPAEEAKVTPAKNNKRQKAKTTAKSKPTVTA